MRLKSLKVERFAGLNPGAELRDIHEKITVVSGPNEAGKSTLFKGLIFALYQRHTVAGQEAVQSIVPAGTTGVAPRVEVTFDVGNRTLRISKQFIKSKGATLEEMRNGIFEVIAQESAADEQLREILGAGEPKKGVAGADLRGIGEILVVDQGRLRLRELSALTKDRLRSVIQNVGITNASHGLMQRVAKRYLEIFTERGEYRSGQGAPAVVVEKKRLEEVRRELEEIRARVAEAEQLESKLAQPDEGPGEREKADAQEELRMLEISEVEAVRYDGELRRLTEHIAHLQSQVDALRSAARDIASTSVKLDAARKELASLQEEQAREMAGRDTAAFTLTTTETALKQHADEEAPVLSHEAAHRDAVSARDTHARVDEVSARLDKHTAATAEVSALQAKLNGRPRPSTNELAALRKDLARFAELERELAGLSLRVTLDASVRVSVKPGDAEILVEKDGTQTITGRDPLRLEIDGVGPILVEGPPVPQRAKLTKERTTLTKRIAEASESFGTQDLVALEALAQERASMEADLHARNAARAALFSDEKSVVAARAKLSADQQRLASILARYPDWNGAPPTEAHVRALEQTAKSARQGFVQARNAREDLARVQREDLRRRESQIAARGQRIQALLVEVARMEEALRGLRKDGLRDDERLPRAESLESELATAHAEATQVRHVREKFSEKTSALKKAREKIDEIHKRERDARDNRVRLEARLDDLRASGLWESLGKKEAEEQALVERVDKLSLEADAIAQLYKLLQEEQQRAVDQAVRPIRDRVERMMQQVLGSDVTPDFGADLLPGGLKNARGGSVDFDLLSAGTQDQLALLTRLAFGELYAAEKGRHAFVLDDPLVNTHEERRKRILDILVRASGSLQILIFTCHPEHYRALPEDQARHIAMDQVRLRPS